MSKAIGAAILLASLGGCTVQEPYNQPAPSAINSTAPITQHSVIEVNIESGGGLDALGYTLKQSDLPAFAKEIGTIPVIVRGNSNVEFSKAVEVRDALKAAGVANVVIGTSR